MEAFFLNAFYEQQRHKALKKSFTEQTQAVNKILESVNERKLVNYSMAKEENARRILLVLMPLVEIAWADGRISRPEMDAITEAAENYGLIDDAEGYRRLTEELLSRPSPAAVGRMWQNLRNFFQHIFPDEREKIKNSVFEQANFIAEQSSDSLIGFLRGERVNKDEKESLDIISQQLEKALRAAEEFEITHEREKKIMEQNKRSDENLERNLSYGMICEELIPLVPLVKVAWAEGRITKRERELIFEAAARMGISGGSESYRRLCDWLELHPTDDFYADSLNLLRSKFAGLPEEDRALKRLDLLSDCVNIAEASGGTTRFHAGGPRVCDEEFTVVKHIARKLNEPNSVSLSA